MPEKYSPQLTTPDAHSFDVEAAETERRNWRIGGELPTERALGLDEALLREHADEVTAEKARRAEEEAEWREFLDRRLGGLASSENRPDDN